MNCEGGDGVVAAWPEVNNWIEEIRVARREPPVSAWELRVQSMAGFWVRTCWRLRDERDL